MIHVDLSEMIAKGIEQSKSWEEHQRWMEMFVKKRFEMWLNEQSSEEAQDNEHTGSSKGGNQERGEPDDRRRRI